MKEVVLKNAPIAYGENEPNIRFWLVDYPILCYHNNNKTILEFFNLCDLECPTLTLDLRQEGLTFVGFVSQFPKDYDAAISFLCYRKIGDGPEEELIMRTIDYKNPFKKRDSDEAFYLERKEQRLGKRAEMIREHLKR